MNKILEKIDFPAMQDKLIEWILNNGLKVILIFIAALIATKIIHFIVNRSFRYYKSRRKEEESLKRVETLNALTEHIVGLAIFLLAIMLALPEFGIEIGPIIAAAGIVGLAVGFGAQSLVKDIISGFFILLEDQIRVGDVVLIAGKGGVVEKINLRTVVIRDLAGNVHYVPSGTIDVVTNMTKDYSRYVFEIGAAYREDVDEVIEVMQQVDAEMREDQEFGPDILEPMEILGLDKFGDSSIVIKARTTTKPIKQWRTAREYNRRLKKAFDAKDIEIPFPHVTLYMGQDKDGSAPPMNVAKVDKELPKS